MGVRPRDREWYVLCRSGPARRAQLSPPRPRVRDPQGERRRRAGEARPRARAAPREPGGGPRLGLRRRPRRGHVAHAAAAHGGRLRGRDRRVAQRARAGGGRLRLRRARLAPARARGPGAAPAGGGRAPGGRRLEGAPRARLGAARLLVVTSSDVYGEVRAEDLPIVEETPLRPVSVYGASKAAADIAAAQWARAYGLQVVRARPFSHAGPGQDAAFVCSALARQLALIEAAKQDPVVRVGNADPVRDFSDVRDIAAGYVALLERGRTGEAYNLCSGDGVSIAEVIALLRTHARVPVRVHSDPALRRAHDVPRIVGSHATATEHTGWRPARQLSATLRDLLEDWRARIAAGG